MKNYRVEFIDKVSEELKKIVLEGFGRHSIEMTGHDEKFESVAFVAYNGDNFAGIIEVVLFWGALHIKKVYINEDCRGQGLGNKLMELACGYGRENKCPFAFVETMSFQALGFYQKNGFQLEFTRPGYSHGCSFHYLKKDLMVHLRFI